MICVDRDRLKPLANKYVWWKTSDEAVSMPERIIAQVMNLGDYTDVQILANQVGDDVLREVLSHAEAGQFNERSWAYWHYRLGLASMDSVPELPMRQRLYFFPSYERMELWKRQKDPQAIIPLKSVNGPLRGC